MKVGKSSHEKTENIEAQKVTNELSQYSKGKENSAQGQVLNTDHNNDPTINKDLSVVPEVSQDESKLAKTSEDFKSKQVPNTLVNQPLPPGETNMQATQKTNVNQSFTPVEGDLPGLNDFESMSMSMSVAVDEKMGHTQKSKVNEGKNSPFHPELEILKELDQVSMVKQSKSHLHTTPEANNLSPTEGLNAKNPSEYFSSKSPEDKKSSGKLDVDASMEGVPFGIKVDPQQDSSKSSLK